MTEQKDIFRRDACAASAAADQMISRLPRSAEFAREQAGRAGA